MGGRLRGGARLPSAGRLSAVIDPTASYRWWLHLQLGLALSGGLVWFLGAFLGEDFVAGAGCGLLVGALVLRLGRKAARPD